VDDSGNIKIRGFGADDALSIRKLHAGLSFPLDNVLAYQSGIADLANGPDQFGVSDIQVKPVVTGKNYFENTSGVLVGVGVTDTWPTVFGTGLTNFYYPTSSDGSALSTTRLANDSTPILILGSIKGNLGDMQVALQVRYDNGSWTTIQTKRQDVRNNGTVIFQEWFTPAFGAWSDAIYFRYSLTPFGNAFRYYNADLTVIGFNFMAG